MKTKGIEKVTLSEKFKIFSDYWSPRIVGNLNKQLVKVAKFKGDFVNHKHDHEDELFMVVKGVLFIELEDKTLELAAGEFVIIPRNTLHRPYAPEEVHVLLFEPETTLNTGNQVNELTVKTPKKI